MPSMLLHAHAEPWAWHPKNDDGWDDRRNFDPNQSYSWAVVHWTGTYTGPTDFADLNACTIFDTSAFGNSFYGTFAWNRDLEFPRCS